MGITVTDVGLEKKLGTHELKKHAATIHCSNSLSLLQRKISNALLYHAYKELMLREEHEISVKQLCNLIAYSGNNHAAIKDALKGLLSTVIEWNVVNDTTGAEDWTASSMLASVSLKGPICLYAYSPRMKQLLHSPSMFGKINLFIQSRFKSSYGLALYENCVRYRGLPHTKWFELDLFRKLMGVPSDTYTIFRDFKRRVLDKSIEEINTYSDILVETEIQREGKQVVKIRFNLKERPKRIRLGSKLLEESVEKSVDDPVEEMKSMLVTKYGLSLAQSEQAMEDYGMSFIAEKIQVIESSANYQKGNVKNLAAYVMSALKNDYQQPKSSTEMISKTQKQSAQQKDSSHELQRVVDRINKNYVLYRERALDQAIDTLSVDAREALLAEFTESASESIETILRLQRKKYTRDTVLQSPQMKALLRQFVLQRMPELKTQLLSIEEFVATIPPKQRLAWEQFHETIAS